MSFVIFQFELIMDKKKINRTLFKYRECNDYSFKIFDERELWFSKPESLNDPFDCQLDFEASLRHALSKVSLSKLDKVDDIIKEASDYVKSIGILSMSRTKRNILMWSHYAEEHKGFCIGFKESNLLSSIETEQGKRGERYRLFQIEDQTNIGSRYTLNFLPKYQAHLSGEEPFF